MLAGNSGSVQLQPTDVWPLWLCSHLYLWRTHRPVLSKLAHRMTLHSSLSKLPDRRVGGSQQNPIHRTQADHGGSLHGLVPQQWPVSHPAAASAAGGRVATEPNPPDTGGPTSRRLLFSCQQKGRRCTWASSFLFFIYDAGAGRLVDVLRPRC